MADMLGRIYETMENITTCPVCKRTLRLCTPPELRITVKRCPALCGDFRVGHLDADDNFEIIFTYRAAHTRG